jgi:hypothetical protein
MKAYLISYDLKIPNRDYSGLYKAIGKYTPWWHFLESVWIVMSDSTPGQIWNALQSHIDTNDRILIIEVRDNVSGWLPKGAWDWIKQHVPSAQY